MFLRRFFRRKSGSLCAVASMGGVGSTALARHIGSISDKTDLEHAYSPEVYEQHNGIKLGYVYGCPYNSVLSVFRRKFQQMHVEAMNANSPTNANKLKGMSIEEYLERGIDEFHIMRQFDNWLNEEICMHPTILIKYEELGKNIGSIMDFFECPKEFIVKSRRSAWQEQPKNIQDGLERMYGDLNAKIEGMPGIKVIQPLGS